MSRRNKIANQPADINELPRRKSSATHAQVSNFSKKYYERSNSMDNLLQDTTATNVQQQSNSRLKPTNSTSVRPSSANNSRSSLSGSETRKSNNSNTNINQNVAGRPRCRASRHSNSTVSTTASTLSSLSSTSSCSILPSVFAQHPDRIDESDEGLEVENEPSSDQSGERKSSAAEVSIAEVSITEDPEESPDPETSKSSEEKEYVGTKSPKHPDFDTSTYRVRPRRSQDVSKPPEVPTIPKSVSDRASMIVDEVVKSRNVGRNKLTPPPS